MNRFTRIPLFVITLAAASLGASSFAFADDGAAHAKSHAEPAHAKRGGFEHALASAGLRADQRAQADAIVAAMKPSREASRDARKALIESVAAQTEIGKFDRAALRAKVDAVATAADDERAAERTAIEKLHALMDPAERVAFADAMRGGGGAHAGGHGGGEAKHLARELKLSADQEKQVEQALGELRAARPEAPQTRGAKSRAGRSFEGFKADKLAIDSVVPNDARAKSFEHAERTLKVAEKVTPILTAEQRAVLGKKLRERAAHGAPIVL